MILELDHLIIARERRLFGPDDACVVRDVTGTTLGHVVAEGRRARRSLLTRLTALTTYIPRTLRLDEAGGRTVLRIVISWTILRTTMRAFDDAENLVGTVRQRELFHKRNFDVTRDRESIGCVSAEDDRGWRFRVVDAAGVEAALITRRVRGKARELWLSGGEYDLLVAPRSSPELRLLALAVAISAELAFASRDMIGWP